MQEWLPPAAEAEHPIVTTLNSLDGASTGRPNVYEPLYGALYGDALIRAGFDTVQSLTQVNEQNLIHAGMHPAHARDIYEKLRPWIAANHPIVPILNSLDSVSRGNVFEPLYGTLYGSLLVEAGFDTLRMLREATEQQLIEAGLPAGHAQDIHHKLSAGRGLAGAAWLGQTPKRSDYVEEEGAGPRLDEQAVRRWEDELHRRSTVHYPEHLDYMHRHPDYMHHHPDHLEHMHRHPEYMHHHLEHLEHMHPPPPVDIHQHFQQRSDGVHWRAHSPSDLLARQPPSSARRMGAFAKQDRVVSAAKLILKVINQREVK